ncbi:hypothetical protein EPO05_06020 [Patescibacteria group bacterium]|nr:MAG: hypothetical protein EPO05_06020 [Patescibacteria group bacterium]
MQVLQIPFDEASKWIKVKHYAHRLPSITYAFGLYDNNKLLGVVSYGIPASNTLVKGICGEEYASLVLELNRLVIEEGSPKNSASFLVANSFKLLPKPTIIVSYADTGQGHVGYIYQATNFIYTGLSDRHVEWRVDGEGTKHARHLFDKLGGIKQAKAKLGERMVEGERPRKHRYIYFIGCTKAIKDALKYKPLPYPKGESKRYDADKEVSKQLLLI